MNEAWTTPGPFAFYLAGGASLAEQQSKVAE